MVQTYQSPVRVYKHPFELVMAAYERRFPTCPQIPIFVGSEIIEEFHSPDGAEEVITRKCQLNVDAPYLVKKVIGVDYIYFIQKNSLDRRKRTLNIEASNISFSNRVSVIEYCNYYVHTENANWTCFEQSASLDVKSFFGFEASIEKLAVKQYGANLAKGKEILEFFIEDLIKSGVTYIPLYVESKKSEPFVSSITTNSKVVEAPTQKTNSPSDSAIDVSKCVDEDTSNHVKEVIHKPSGVPTHTVQKEAMPAQVIRRKSRISVTGGTATNINTSSFDEPELKLETEYIRRFLGELNQLEESRLCELKYGLQSEHKGKLPNDAHLLRFLRARQFDVHKSRDMIVASLLWRKQHNVDKILEEFLPPPVLLNNFPGGWHHNDLQDRPLFILQLGQMDVKGILRSVGLEVVVKFTLSICEQGLLKAEEATRRLGKPISTWTLLVDLEGLSLRHLWRPGVQSLLRIIEIVENNYPETMGLVLITRAPRVFPVLWTLVSPFIDETTRKKFMINTNESLLNELAKYISKDLLPDFLGGPSHFTPMGSFTGGHVPKSEYKTIDMEEALKEDDILTSNYHNVTISRGTPQEVCVHVPTAGSVLTWDFDIIKGDCEFLLYHTDKTLTKPNQPSSPTLNPVERVTNLLSTTSTINSNPTAIVVSVDPELRLGPNLSIQVPAVLFGEGDSMQGSHYCSLSGTYILQWRYISEATATAVNHPTTSFDFSIQSHKCKLMYYYQLLNSADFKGSVASLESRRSSFGSLAAGTISTGKNFKTLDLKLNHSSSKSTN